MSALMDAAPARSRGSRAIRQALARRVSTRESLRFLTQVGNALAASLDYEITLQTVAELTVPRLACFCELDLIEEGQLKRVGLAHVSRAQREVLEGRMLLPLEAEAAGPLADVIATGASLLVTGSGSDDALLSDAERARVELLRRADATSLLLIPLVARGRPLGVLLLASTRSDRLYGNADVALAEEVARIAALAIDNARLYREATRSIHARDDVLRVVSHDLRNPIGAMALAASFVLDDSSDAPEGPSGRMLRTIVRASRQATRMIDDLLDVSRIESGRMTVEPRPEALTAILMEAVELHCPLALERGVRLDWTVRPPLPPVLVDRERVLQLLGNLLANAIRFTPPEGRVELRAGLCGGEVHCSVCDSGPGIPPDQLPRVFDRFWQALRSDRAGLGLGLAIARGIAEAHGGRMWVENEPGLGACFSFTLPLAQPAGVGRTLSA